MQQQYTTLPVIEMEMEALRASIVRGLLYYDIFRHALTLDEIVAACDVPVESKADVEVILDELLSIGAIRTARGYYWVGADPSYANLRLARFSRSSETFPKAVKYIERIARFPFVQGILVTGSMSHSSMDEFNDVDYLVFTTPGRLWITRSLLMFYKKTVLRNACTFFCINYLLDTDHLKILEQNRFTATEIAAAIPVYGTDVCRKFFASNQWVKRHLPNTIAGERSAFIEESGFGFKLLLERLLNAPGLRHLTDLLDTSLMNLTEGVWKRKFGSLPMDRFELQFRTRKYASKHHPKDYQNKVVLRLEDRIRAFEREYGPLAQGTRESKSVRIEKEFTPAESVAA